MDTIYCYENLPNNHWKKYIYASRFIQLVRAKTPKVTFYSARAKCQLMETLEDIEMNFYEGGKIVKTPTDIKIIGHNGQNILLSIVTNNLHTCSESIRLMWTHYLQCVEHCKNIERTLRNISTDSECFPIIIGRRPASAPILNTVKEYNSPNLLTTPKLSNVIS